MQRVLWLMIIGTALTAAGQAQTPQTPPTGAPAGAGRGGGRGGPAIVSPQVNADKTIGKDDNLTGAAAKALDATLTAKGVKHTFIVGEGRHEWVVWRHHLWDVAPLLFR